MNKKVFDSISLENMAVHCKKGDYGFNFVITVGIASGNGCNNDNNTPYANIFIKDKDYKSRFLLTNDTIPQKEEDLKTVDDTDMPLTIVAKDLIKWINAKPIRSYSKGNKTNWEAMKSSWIDIQEVLQL